jgi:NTE family protein
MIAFVISGGGNRGALAAGAMLGLLEAGIRPDILVGTSAGALNAAGLATEPTLEGAKRLAKTWASARKADFFPGGWLSMFSRLLTGRSLFPSGALRKYVERQLPEGKRRFGDLQGVRLYITAANLNTGTLYLYGDQPDALIIDAVMASVAHPLAFSPVKHDKWQLVDGGVVANVPVGIALDKGATEIYILNVGFSGEMPASRSNVFNVLDRSISVMMYQHFLLDLKHAVERSDVTLHHIAMREFQHLPLWDLRFGSQMVEIGRNAVQDYLRNPTGLQGVPVGDYGRIEEPPPPAGAETYVPPWLSPSGLLDLPLLERQIATHLVRRGPADAETLAQALGRGPTEVREALALLAGKGQVCLSPAGQASITFGWSRRRRVPDHIWASLSSETDCQEGEQ